MVWGAFSIKGPNRAIRYKRSWMVPNMLKFFKNISFLMQGSNLDDNGSFNKTMNRKRRSRVVNECLN